MEDYKKKYEHALENFKKIKAANKDNKELIDFIEYNYPELKESEDERIRKGLIDFLKSPFVNENITDEKVTPWIAWLEKQGEQKSEEVDNLHNYLYDEQKPADEVGNYDHKKVLETIINEQNPAWSKEDEYIYSRIIRRYTDYKGVIVRTKEESVANKMLDAMTQEEIWLKSLKERYTWKPSDEQMNALNDVISSRDIKYDVLSELYLGLKKLREE